MYSNNEVGMRIDGATVWKLAELVDFLSVLWRNVRLGVKLSSACALTLNEMFVQNVWVWYDSMFPLDSVL